MTVKSYYVIMMIASAIRASPTRCWFGKISFWRAWVALSLYLAASEALKNDAIIERAVKYYLMPNIPR